MPSKSQLETLNSRVNAHHQRQFKPPLMRWIEEQDTERLTRVRAMMEQGVDIVTAIRTVLDDG
jgi:hypothetical protein